MGKDRLLRSLPSVDELLRSGLLSAALDTHPRVLVVDALRAALADARAFILAGRSSHQPASEEIALAALERLSVSASPNLRRVINATGTVLHTNLGRAVLSAEAARAAAEAAGGAVNLEFDLETGQRGERDTIVEGLIQRLTGAEATSVVNNNAAAVLLALNTLAEGREVVVSRGELIEIGGSFRLPEVIKKSGCVMREVGTTNRTHASDYSSAIGADTAVLFKAHTSNFRVIGFTAEVSLSELSAIGKARSIPVVEDLGSGCLVDLSAWGLPREPIVAESIRDGADMVTFSGDKLLGGPQAGIIAGRRGLIERIRKNPLKRALRADKLTLAALEATLRLYLDTDRLAERLPVLRQMSRSVAELEAMARKAAGLVSSVLGADFAVTVEDSESVAGGGSMPGHNIPSRALAIRHPALKPEAVSWAFSRSSPPIAGRIKNDTFLLDLRTVERAEDLVPTGDIHKYFNNIVK